MFDQIGGWVKLHRALLNWRWASSANHLAVFIQLLLRANYKPSEWRAEIIKPGQLLTGRIQLSDWTGLSESQIRTVLRDLEMTGEITRRKTNQYSIITIVNWDSYQEDSQPLRQPVASGSPAASQPIATSKKANKANKEKKSESAGGYGPLLGLFTGDIQDWLKTGTSAVQEKLFTTYRDETLIREIEKAFFWKCENKPNYKAGTFLTGWLERCRDAQARVSDQVSEHQRGLDIHFELYGEYAENDPRRIQEDEIPEELK